MSSAIPTAPGSSTGRGLLLLGFAFMLAGLALYAAQLFAQRLFTPWYMPVFTLIGLACVVFSIRRRKVWSRRIAFFLVAFIAGSQISFLLLLRLPAYNGPLEIGKPFPAFQTLRADGTPFTQADLPGDQNTVMVFFRGRW